jgi:outer membrane receptor protein involved in Fe transport
MSVLNLTAQLNAMSMKSSGTTLTTIGGNGIDAYRYGSVTEMKMSRTSFNGSLDYQRFFNTSHTHSLALTYQLNYSPASTKMSNNFSNAGTLADRFSDNKENTTNHIFQLDYTMPFGEGQTLNLGGKLQLHDATSDSKYYLKDVYDPSSSSEYEYKNSILAGYGEYAGNWDNFGLKAGLRYEYTWQDVKYHLGHGDDFKKDYGTLVPTASLQYNLSQGSNLGLTYNLRISRPGISYLNPYIDQTNPIAISYGNPTLDVEKNHNISLVYNMFTSKLMLNINLHHNFVDNGISQYSFYDANNVLNTTYGNVVKRHQTGVNGYVNYLLTKDTRLFFNGSLNYLDLRSEVLDQQNSGWTASAMIGLQQTLPWNLKLSAFAITSTKSYTLQGWSGGFNLLTASLSKSLINDKLNLSVSGILGLNGGGKINIESENRGKNFTSHTTVKVPIYGVSLTVTYTFGNSKVRAKQHTSRVQNDFIEQQSQGEVINSIGNQAE